MKRKNLKESTDQAKDLAQLKADYLWAVQQRDSNIFSRQRLNFETRNCVWKGQSADGKKHRKNYGVDVFPWEGAADSRVQLVDKYINEDVALLMVLWSRMRTIVFGVESNDAQFATRMTNFLRWMKYTQMEEAFDEAELLANYILENGSAVLGVFWCQQTQLGYEEIDLETVRTFAMEMGRRDPESDLANLPALIMDPEQIDRALAVAETFYPDLPRDRLRKVVNDLRATGAARFPRRYQVKSRPEFVAFCPNYDFFIPPEATDLQKASALWRRELLTESALRERVLSNQWNEAWVEQMIETQRGRITVETDAKLYNRRANYLGALDAAKLFEVIHAYRRLSDAEGVPGIYYTCFSPGILDQSAYHDLLNYDHGQYPCIHFQREKRSRWIDDSRGYGEIASTWQQQIKVEWDSRIDRASIATLPPFYHPPGLAPAAWGPGVKVPTMRRDDYGFADVPQRDLGSQEVEESVRKFADEYFGRPVDEQNAVAAQIMKQHLANAWMNGWKRADSQMLQLCQQFMPDEFYYRVVGSMKGRTIRATREEIQGKFDLGINYNVQDLDPEYVKSKLELIERALQMDVNGIVDRNEALAFVFDMVDPNSGERLLKPAEAAAQQEIEDEQTVFVKLLNAIPVDIKPGQAYQLRLDVLKNLFNQNAQAQERYQQDPQVKQAFENRVKQLTQQLVQRENAITGRLGAPSAMTQIAQ